MTISIAGLDKAAVLAALYNAARPQGLGFLQYDPTPMTKDEAQKILGGRMHLTHGATTGIMVKAQRQW